MQLTGTLALPDVPRSDCTLVTSNEVVVQHTYDQRRAADVVLDAWDIGDWPEGLLAHAAFIGTDGITVQHYVQWQNAQAFDAFQRAESPDRVQYISRNAPPLTRELPVQFELYRSVAVQDGAVPGCIVIIRIEFEGPDAARQRDWVDTVIAALEHDEGVGGLPRGGLAAHFHVSLDGTRVLNYAEWQDEASHAAALLEGGGDSIGKGSPWERVRTYPGLKGFGFKRFMPYRIRTAPDGPEYRP